MHLQHLLQPNSSDLIFSKSLVREGACLWLPADLSLPKNNKQVAEFIKAAAPYAHLLVQPPKGEQFLDFTAFSSCCIKMCDYSLTWCYLTLSSIKASHVHQAQLTSGFLGG